VRAGRETREREGNRQHHARRLPWPVRSVNKGKGKHSVKAALVGVKGGSRERV